MPDESPGVKTLWLTFGSATICGKEVDNFQPKNSDSAQAPDSARGFFQRVRSPIPRRSVNHDRRRPKIGRMREKIRESRIEVPARNRAPACIENSRSVAFPIRPFLDQAEACADSQDLKRFASDRGNSGVRGEPALPTAAKGAAQPRRRFPEPQMVGAAS